MIGMRPIWYEIHVQGQLNPGWQDWFEGFEIEYRHGDTLLSGSVADQAALYGVLLKIHNLGLTLMAVNRLRQND